MVELIPHIEESVINALQGKSKIDSNVLSIDGMSSSRNRHLLNNILNMPDINYLEIGIFKGSTFISALYKNKVNFACAIESSFSECIDIKTSFLNNCATFNIADFLLIEEDCFSFDLTKIKFKINVYFYDGDHQTDTTGKSLTHFYNILADEFIYIVDDYDWDIVWKGVLDGIYIGDFDVLYKKHLKSDGPNAVNSWWNGIGIYILRKK